MTLKKKFENYFDPKWLDKEVSAHHCEQIADNYAIEFAEWLAFNNLFYSIEFGNNRTIDLLEQFKKEKGL